jgi:hypothetical protein
MGFALAAALAAPAAAQDAAKFAPDDSTVLVGINIKQIAASAVMQKYGEKLLQKNAAEAVKSGGAAGIAQALKDAKTIAAVKDFVNKVDTVYVGVAPSKGEAVFAAVGRFDAAAVKDLIDRVKPADVPVKAEKIGNVDVWEIGGAADAGWVAATAGVLVLTDSKEKLAAAVDKLGGNRKTRLKKEITDLLGMADMTRSVWLVAHEDDARFVAGIQIADEISAEVVMPAGSAEAAESQAKEIGELLKLLKVQAGAVAMQNAALAPLADLANSLAIAVKGGNVVITAKLTAAQIEKAANAP